MRKRTNMSGLISHNRPTGKSNVSHRERCVCRLQKLEKMLADNWDIVHSEAIKDRTPKEVVVSIFGGKVKMTLEEYHRYGEGFKVIMEIF